MLNIIPQIIFTEQVLLIIFIAGSVIALGITISLFLLWVGMVKDINKNNYGKFT